MIDLVLWDGRGRKHLFDKHLLAYQEKHFYLVNKQEVGQLRWKKKSKWREGGHMSGWTKDERTTRHYVLFK